MIKREDLRKVEVKVCKENKKGFLETNTEEGYFHTWSNKDAIVELKDGTVEVVSYKDIRFVTDTWTPYYI